MFLLGIYAALPRIGENLFYYYIQDFNVRIIDRNNHKTVILILL